MHYLVDGHNLISNLPEIDLSDPDDEAKLVELLHRFVLRHPRHRVTVVFDGGVYGHPASLKRERVDVIFAHSPGDADTRLIRLLQTVPHKQGYTLVSADRTITNAAAEQGIAVKSPRVFAVELHAPSVARPSRSRRPHPEPKPSRAEVDEWLKIFGVDQD